MLKESAVKIGRRREGVKRTGGKKTKVGKKERN
jgi:hypothetical protein